MTFGPHEGNQRRNVPDPVSFRWLPRHGEPMRMIERVSQSLIKTLAWLPAYTAIVITVVLLLQIFVLARLF